MADAPTPGDPAAENPPKASSQEPAAPVAPASASPGSSASLPPSPSAAAQRRKDTPLDPAHVPMTEEFDRAKWTLPPLGIVLVGIGIVAVVAAVLAFTERSRPVVAGGLDTVLSVALPDNTSLVSVQMHIRNSTDKRWYIQSIKATVKTDKGEFSDDAAAAVDSARYFQAFPALDPDGTPVLKFDQKLAPGEQENGTVVFSFPITKDDFDKRKSLTVTILPFDNLPVTFAK